MRYIRENPDYQAMFPDKLLKDTGVSRDQIKQAIGWARATLDPQRVDRMMWYMRIVRLSLYIVERDASEYNSMAYERIRVWLARSTASTTQKEQILEDLEEEGLSLSVMHQLDRHGVNYVFADLEFIADPGYERAYAKYNKKALKAGFNPIDAENHFLYHRYDPSLGVEVIQYDVPHIDGGMTLNDQLEHFLAMNIPCIQDTAFGYEVPDLLIETLYGCEREHRKKLADRKALIPDAVARQRRVFLQTSNPNFVWFDLETSDSQEESDCMSTTEGHHCGSDAGATLLSLRQRRELEDGVYWSCHITASLYPDGAVGQIKGKANAPPAERYWPLILEMLFDPRVTYVKKGSWKDWHDFSVTWLTEEEQEEIAEAKPNLFILSEYIKRFGSDTLLLDRYGITLVNRVIKYHGKTFILLNSYFDVKKVERFEGVDTSAFTSLDTIFSRLICDSEDSRRTYSVLCRSYDNVTLPDKLWLNAVERFDDSRYSLVDAFVRYMPLSIHDLLSLDEWTKAMQAASRSKNHTDVVGQSMYFVLVEGLANAMYDTAMGNIEKTLSISGVRGSINEVDTKAPVHVANTYRRIRTWLIQKSKDPEDMFKEGYWIAIPMESYVKALAADRYRNHVKGPVLLTIEDLSFKEELRTIGSGRRGFNSRATYSAFVERLYNKGLIDEDMAYELLQAVEDEFLEGAHILV